MTNELMKTAADLIYLVSYAVNETEPDKDVCEKMDLQAVFKLSREHLLTACAACALEKVMPLPQYFKDEKLKAIRLQAFFNMERVKICAALEQNGIWYLPLKGVLMKELYPFPPMREMTDKAHINDPKRKSNQLRTEIEAEKKRMRDLTDEIADSLTGNGRFTPEVLSNALDSCKRKIVTKSSELTEIEAQLSNQTHELKTLDTRFEQFVSWADEFENAPVPRQRMIVNLLLDGVYVFRGYKILVTMKSTYKQFLSDWIDKAS